MGEEVKINETKTLATDEEGKGVETEADGETEAEDGADDAPADDAAE